MSKRPLDPRMSKAWAGWAFVGILSFLALEGYAIGFVEHGTLSENVWAFLDGGWSRYVLLGGFFGWLTVHFFGKGRAG